MIYFVTVNFYSSELISTLIKSLRTESASLYRIVIVNNSPNDIFLNKLSSELVTLIVNNVNVGFGIACNIALTHIYQLDPTALVWFINPDAYLLEGSVQKINAFFDTHSEISILGTVIDTPDGQCWFAGGNFNALTGSITVITKNIINKYGTYMSTSWVSGCSLIVNLNRFLECPMFSPLYFLYYEDFDFCIRYSRQGHYICITDIVHVVHNPSSTTNRNFMVKFKYSTSSYLTALFLHTNFVVFLLRFIRVIIMIILFLPIQSVISRGKLLGIVLYFRQFKLMKKNLFGTYQRKYNNPKSK